MIRIQEIPAPREIETAQVRHLPEALHQFGSGTTTPTREDLDGYQVARHPRWLHQREKCAYCDRDVAEEGHPTEHYRPILGGYWWLTWSWPNLLFACVSCNGSKGVEFPLLPGSQNLSVGQHPPGAELPVLLNPYEDDTWNFITFQKDPKGRWVPKGKDSEGRGDQTIGVLGLKQHVPAYTRWVEETLRPELDAVSGARTAAEVGDGAAVLALQEAWNNLLSRHYGEYTKFRLLTWVVLNQLIPEEEQARLGLPLPRPITSPLPLTDAERAERALLDGLSDAARDRVYALGGRAEPAAWDAALGAVVAEGARTIADLVTLLNRDERTVRGHVSRLVARGVLTISPNGEVQEVS